MSNKSIGIFDSGVGGLTCVKELQKLLPNENIVYLGDTKRMPYGIQDKATLTEYTNDDVSFLNKHNVKLVVGACGTVSSNVEIKDIVSLATPYINIIQPTVTATINATKTKRVAVLATNATKKSKVFVNTIKEKDNEMKVFQVACQRFVKLIETAHISIDDEKLLKVANEYLADVVDFAPDTVILGCTHFPIIIDVIKSILGEDINYINASYYTALAIKEKLEELKMLSTDNSGNVEYFVTDKNRNFDTVAKIFLDTKENITSQKVVL